MRPSAVPVCLEWPSILATRSLLGDDLSDAESASVHAAHDLHIIKPIRSGTTLRTKATLIGVGIKPGAGYTLRLTPLTKPKTSCVRLFSSAFIGVLQ